MKTGFNYAGYDPLLWRIQSHFSASDSERTVVDADSLQRQGGDIQIEFKRPGRPLRTCYSRRLHMPIVHFPDLSLATPEGIVAVGGDLHPDSLRLAYSQGIFPWPQPGYPLLWFCPDPRAILEFDRVHVSKSLQYARRHALRKGWTFTIDYAFGDVVRLCAQVPRCGQRGTWITS